MHTAARRRWSLGNAALLLRSVHHGRVPSPPALGKPTHNVSQISAMTDHIGIKHIAFGWDQRRTAYQYPSKSFARTAQFRALR